MRRREALLEQQPHRVALVAERRLHADEDVAEALAEHVQGAAVALMPARRGAPLPLDLGEPALAAHVVVDRDPRMHVGERAELRGVAVDDPLAQRVGALRHLDRVAGLAMRRQRVRCSDSKTERNAAVPALPAFGGKLNSTTAILRSRARCAAAPPACDARGERLGALRADVHVSPCPCRERAAAIAAVSAGAAGAAAEYRRAGGAVELGDRHHDRALDRQQAALRCCPLLERLELDGMRGDVGHVELARAAPRRPCASL